ncbi:MAG TPA: carboxypeptidase-like regulatory domain-containing protein [Candidatus Limnocylindrales bacterium]|nr:carboxypeptidase-like regulatory domain-containing protein [Candidatus Limnocylindrales bacterium]
MKIGVLTLIHSLAAFALLAQPNGAIEGRVVSKVDGSGIAGATVTVGPRTLITDSGGAFHIDGLAPGQFVIGAKMDGYFPAQVPAAAGGTAAATVTIALTPHAFLAGKVTGADGRPTPRASVEVTQAVRRTGTTTYYWATTTGDDGRYRVGPLQPGSYRILAHAPSEQVVNDTYFPSAPTAEDAQIVVVRGGEQLGGFDIRLLSVPRHSVAGTAFDDHGAPAEATVALSSCTPATKPHATARTAPDGRFRFPGVPEGEWCLTVEALQSGTKLKGGTTAIVHADVSDLAIHLAAPFTYQATVEPREPWASTSNSTLPMPQPAGHTATNAPETMQLFTLQPFMPAATTSISLEPRPHIISRRSASASRMCSARRRCSRPEAHRFA